MLPKHFPRWQNVYRTFRRWSEQGKFEQRHDRLRAQWRERQDRTAFRNVGRWVRPGQSDLFTVNANTEGFVVLARRWVVERTHAWNERARRLVMHHDRLSRVAEAWVWLTEARMLLRWLTT